MLLTFTNRPKNRQKYASLVRSVSEDKMYLRFLFFFNENVHYVKYNKKEGESNIYKFVCGSKTVEPLILFHNDTIIVPIHNSEDFLNPSLAIIDDRLL